MFAIFFSSEKKNQKIQKIQKSKNPKGKKIALREPP
jgi:hypothetical protein